MNGLERVCSLLRKLRLSVSRLDSRLWERWAEGSDGQLAPGLAVQGPSITEDSHEPQKDGLSGLFDGFLWGVPKSRRSIQRNRTRRRAPEKKVNYIPDERFTTCSVCGHSRLTGFLCGHCLIRIRQETRAIRKRLFGQMNETQELPERESVVLYKDETPRPEDEDKQIIKMKRKRPFWFNQALTE